MNTRPRRGTAQPAATEPDTAPVVGSVCTGYGGLDLGVIAALGGGRIAWVADPDPHIAKILAVRMPGVPNLGDLRAIDWTTVEPVDVLTAGFPCQDISAAGKRAGIEKGTRSGLWTDIVAGIRILRPALVVVENVAALRWKGGGLHRVLGDLAEAGYDALWRSVRAADIGAAHRRERVFLLAWLRQSLEPGAADPDGTRRLLQRHQRREQARRSVVAGPPAPAPDPHRHQPERQREPHPLGEASRATPGKSDQRERDGHAPVDRGAIAAHTDRFRREELHPSHPAGRTIAPRPGTTAADSTGHGHRNSGAPCGRRVSTAAVAAGLPVGGDPAELGGVAADTASDGRDEGLPGAARLQGRSDAALGGHPPTHPASEHPGRRHRGRRHLVAVPDPGVESSGSSADRSPTAAVNWGAYEPAIRRWEHILGRPIPHPTQLGNHGRPVLAPAFVEHLMGLSEGWVTDLPLPRTAQLRALGNGVVPQQATYAVGLLLADLAALTTAGLSSDRREMKAA